MLNYHLSKIYSDPMYEQLIVEVEMHEWYRRMFGQFQEALAVIDTMYQDIELATYETILSTNIHQAIRSKIADSKQIRRRLHTVLEEDFKMPYHLYKSEMNRQERILKKTTVKQKLNEGLNRFNKLSQGEKELADHVNEEIMNDLIVDTIKKYKEALKEKKVTFKPPLDIEMYYGKEGDSKETIVLKVAQTELLARLNNIPSGIKQIMSQVLNQLENMQAR